MSVVKFIKTTAAAYSKYTGEVKPVAGAIYYVLDDSVKDAPVGRIYVDGVCYGEANAKGKTVLDASIETDEASGKKGQIKVTYTDGTSSYIPLPEGKVYTAGKGINISESDEISALDEEIGSEIKVTQAVGALKVNQTFTATDTIKDILKKMLQQELQPAVTEPAVSLTFTAAKPYEVGTKLTPSYSASLSAGSYSYGPATGITATSWSVSATGVETPLTTATGSFPEITVADGMNYKITAVATHGAGADPVTNLGNPAEASKRIAAGTKTATSGAITGYRNWFTGFSSEAIDSSSYNSAFVRALTPKNSAVNTAAFTITTQAGTQRVFVAVPTGYKLEYVTDRSALNANITAKFNKYSVQVEGANGYTATEYNLFAYEPKTVLGAATYDVKLIKG